MEYQRNNKSGFRAPEGYFDTLEDRIMQAVSRSQRIPEQDGFEIPSGYMDRAEDRIMSAVTKRDESGAGPVPRKKSPVYTLRDIAYAISAVAAAVVILATVFQVDFSSPERNNIYSLTSVPPEEIEFYIENNMLPLYTEDITEMFDTTDLSTISFSTIEDEELITYLEENLTDYSDLNFDD